MRNLDDLKEQLQEDVMTWHDGLNNNYAYPHLDKIICDHGHAPERHPKHYEVSWSNLSGKTFLLISKDMPNHWKFLVDLLEYEGYKEI